MAKNYYRYKETGLIDYIDDDFAAAFDQFEPVSERVAASGTTVEQNAAALEADADAAPVEEVAPTPKTTKTDSPKEGN